MTEETSQNDKNWFASQDWRTNVVLAVIAILFSSLSGGFSGATVASKSVSPQGITQETADVRYLTKDEADKRSEKRDKQFDRIELKIDANQQKNENEQKEQMKVLLEILQNQKSSK